MGLTPSPPTLSALDPNTQELRSQNAGAEVQRQGGPGATAATVLPEGGKAI